MQDGMISESVFDRPQDHKAHQFVAALTGVRRLQIVKHPPASTSYTSLAHPFTTIVWCVVFSLCRVLWLAFRRGGGVKGVSS